MKRPGISTTPCMTVEQRITSIEHYLRRPDTVVAKTARRISPKTGEEYRNSKLKRRFERTVAGVAAVITAPVVGALVVAARLEDGEPGLYRQERIGKNGETLEIIKIRTMIKDAEEARVNGTIDPSSFRPEDDPRNTRLGKRIRRYNIDELPQLWQVARGKLALTGNRANIPYDMQRMKEKLPQSFGSWEAEYLTKVPGVFSLNAVMNAKSKDVLKRMHYDHVYNRSESFGLNLFILAKYGLDSLRSLVKHR